jgi:hypothetical protein
VLIAASRDVSSPGQAIGVLLSIGDWLSISGRQAWRRAATAPGSVKEHLRHWVGRMWGFMAVDDCPFASLLRRGS